MPRIFGPMVKPGVSFSTTKLAKRCGPASPSSVPVRASRVTPKDMSVPALEMKVLRPLISQPPSRRFGPGADAAGVGAGVGLGQAEGTEGAPLGQGPQPPLALLVVAEEQSGREPMVTCACHAAATDWSASPICSMAATKPTVDMPMPPHSSGTSMPEQAQRPISRSRSVGQRASSQAGRSPGGDLLLREVPAQLDQLALGLGEREVHGPSYGLTGTSR